MNISFHYYTIKTLARQAGLDEDTAQFIAHCSQQVDQYILNSPFLVEQKPPAFFLDNDLAREHGKNRWIFSPCPTGVNALRSVSHKYQIHTLMPFHFITPTPYSVLQGETDRELLRCETAGQDKRLLIDKLIGDMLRQADIRDKTWQMAFGMLLHTYADTYAHAHFSGFHGWENESYVDIMTCGQNGKPLMRPAEIAFYRTLPSIGHGNVGHAPDYGGCRIVLYAKRRQSSPLEPLIQRDNTAFFADCAKRIFGMLCQVNGRVFPGDAPWHELQWKLAKAQSIPDQSYEKAIQKSWASVFPDIRYHYDRNEYIKVNFRLLRHEEQLMGRINMTKSQLLDMHSETGDQARAASLMLAKNVSELFYLYNELAYRHVYAVTGEYASKHDAAQLTAFGDWAGAVTAV